MYFARLYLFDLSDYLMKKDDMVSGQVIKVLLSTLSADYKQTSFHNMNNTEPKLLLKPMER